jgi:hypothetical protein
VKGCLNVLKGSHATTLIFDNERAHVRKMVHLVAQRTWVSHPFIY